MSVTYRSLTATQRAALTDAAQRGYVTGGKPAPGYPATGRPGQHHFRAVDKLVELGLLSAGTWDDPACRITDVGRALVPAH